MSNSILNYLPLAKKKTAHEYAAPCPSCGGNDRFTVWPDRPRGGAYLCRGCNAQGDGIEFLKQFHSMAYVDACRALGIVPNGKASGGRVSYPAKAKQPAPIPPPAAATPPPDQWRTMASQFLTTCQSDLYSVDAILALTGRYLTPHTARAAGIGYNERDRYELRSEWGLDPVQDTNGKIRDKLLLPAGIVIASRRRAGIMGLTIRTIDPARAKFWQVQGGNNTPYIMGKQGLPVIMLESALDAALLWQECADLVACIALHGNMKGLDADTAAFIQAAPLVIACPDCDAGGRAAWKMWRQAFPLAVPIPALGGKDVGDMHKAALTLDKNLALDMTVPTAREWVQAALSIARAKATGCPTSHETAKSDHKPHRRKNMPQTENTGAKQCRFKKGESGNPQGKPKGCKHHATRAALTLLEGQLEAITQTAIDAALGGDMGAVKLVLDKVLPPARERHLHTLELPTVSDTASLPTLTARILDAVGNGDLLPSEGERLTAIVSAHGKMIELHQLETRLTALEADRDHKR